MERISNERTAIGNAFLGLEHRVTADGKNDKLHYSIAADYVNRRWVYTAVLLKDTIRIEVENTDPDKAIYEAIRQMDEEQSRRFLLAQQEYETR